MAEATASSIQPDSDTPMDADIVATIRAAEELGLGVSLMPYIRLRGAQPGDWRGTIRPANVDRWWSSYGAFLRHYALLTQGRTKIFAIGSELTSMSGNASEPRWERLAEDLRNIGSPRLAFVANHDALDLQGPFAHVDVAGVSAYFPLSGPDDWEVHAGRLRRFSAEVERPLVIFELGFPSRRGALQRPWDHIAGTPVDVDAQALGYQSATMALEDEDWLQGLFFWAWYGEGGRYDRSYSPRGKPAMQWVRRFFKHFASLDSMGG